ncbi:MAG: UvrD-helicase domain-containing protein [Lachnospiraceae bacterium]|nr:UvrD-helicase domain-containing protein [Lachnospiraceae bacterium]
MYIADLHIHSHYSRATSKDCMPEYLDLWARRKGIGIVGSGDFTHPEWRKELEEKLEPSGNGLYVLKKEYRIKDHMAADSLQPHFVITGEISSIYKKYDRVRKVHSLILLPGLEEAEIVSRKLEAVGNIHSDGRPILGLDCHDLLELLLESCPEAVYVPAHIWTPHFSLFGAFSGFDSVEECYGDLSSYIHAVETGLSSDPPMNWRVSALDSYQLISNSDAHSPAKLGREANLVEIELSYEGLRKAIQTGEGLAGTIEFFPEEGKYHYDGHRKCGLCLSPSETNKYGGICPVCKRKLTVGVSHRIEQLADRPEGYRKEHGAPFESLVPLPEVIGASVGRSAASAWVEKEYLSMLRKLGPEFSILRELPLEEIRKASGALIAEGIGRLRRGEVTRLPGFDGEYGSVRLFTGYDLDRLDGQMSLFEFQPELFSESQEEKRTEFQRQTGEQSLDEPQHPGKRSERQAAEPEREKKTHTWNEKQRQAITSTERVTAVTAGPGTGKTGTLAAHILYLLEVRRVKPSCITAVTFTNRAAKEMRERIRKQPGKSAAARKLQIGTFHSIAWKLLKEEGTEFVVAGDMETRDLADRLIKEYSLERTVSQFLTQISNYKTGMSDLPDSGVEREALEAYQSRLKEWNALDFDDILLEALRIAKEREKEDEKNTGAGAFSYLMVDEFQDISPLQYQLIKAWNEGGKELFVIGDQDQAIYGFRGADAECFRKLEEDFPQPLRITLEENYRSAPEILEVACEVIARNPGGERRLKPNRPKGELVRIIEAESEMSEAIFVAKEINRLAGGIGMLEAQQFFPEREEKSFGFEDIAVLYRTHRQAKLLETCLKKEGIPYVVAGREDFLQEPAVHGTVSFFRSLLQPEDLLAGQRALELLWNQETGDTAAGIYETLAEKYRPFLKKKKPWKLLEEWTKETGLEKKEGMKKLHQTAVFYQTMEEFMEALESGVESDLRRCSEKRYLSGAVTLMTLHGSKGLEFPAVMIYGVRKNLIPFESRKYLSDEEEERRLFYVGLTRAKETLIITSSKEPSTFLEEIPQKMAVREKASSGKNTGNGRQMSLFELFPKT